MRAAQIAAVSYQADHPRLCRGKSGIADWSLNRVSRFLYRRFAPNPLHTSQFEGMRASGLAAHLVLSAYATLPFTQAGAKACPLPLVPITSARCNGRA